MKISVIAPIAPTWPVGTLALVRKKGQSDAVVPFVRFHAANYDRATDGPVPPPSRIINLSTGSVRYETPDDYVVIKVLGTLDVQVDG